jgi:hypothetical protein
MTNKSQIIIFLSLMLFLTGCFGLGDSGSDRIIGKYIVLWIDFPENQIISEQVEMNSAGSIQVIQEYVFAVGHNDDYIIAKQHPTSGFEGGYEINTKITNYFILDMNRKVSTVGENVFGPLNQNEFDSLRKTLKIENIEFDQKYPEKP